MAVVIQIHPRRESRAINAVLRRMEQMGLDRDHEAAVAIVRAAALVEVGPSSAQLHTLIDVAIRSE